MKKIVNTVLVGLVIVSWAGVAFAQDTVKREAFPPGRSV